MVCIILQLYTKMGGYAHVFIIWYTITMYIQMPGVQHENYMKILNIRVFVVRTRSRFYCFELVHDVEISLLFALYT